MSDWQPIETAPKDGKPLDLWVECRKHIGLNGRRVDCCWLNGKWQQKGSWLPHVEFAPTGMRATYWMRVEAPDV